MSTATIISNIRKLPLAEQHFVVEQVLQLIHNTERKQVEFPGIGSEHSIFGVPQTIEQLKSSVKNAETQYKMGLGKSNEDVFSKYAQWK
ncbi:MAG: hypothetical protein FWD60_01000 [Candidatus Azobacteroides sp.]|nr:hypothetical protein [Candidatus Azobacteroides sp.]